MKNRISPTGIFNADISVNIDRVFCHQIVNPSNAEENTVFIVKFL